MKVMPWQSWLETRMDTTTFKILLKTLFKGDAPHLRSFSIERCTVDFTLPIFRKFTKLHALWLQMLNEMPVLQELKICNAIGMLLSRDAEGGHL